MRRRHLATVAAVLLLAGGCSRGSGGRAEVEVVAAFYPLAEAAARVGGGGVAVTNLTPPGTEPHDLELTSKQLDAVIDADVVLYLGRHFQPAVADAAARAKGERVDVLPDDPADPHVWLDPLRMVDIVLRVEAALAKANPEGAAAYRANAARYAGQLRDLDADFARGLANCERKRIVTAHEAFGYLAARYGLEQSAVTGLSPESEPDPKRLAELADEVRADGTTTVFTEELVSPKVAEALAREAGVRTEVLNPIEGLTRDEAAAGETYTSVMHDNLARLQAALGCH